MWQETPASSPLPPTLTPDFGKEGIERGNGATSPLLALLVAHRIGKHRLHHPIHRERLLAALAVQQRVALDDRQRAVERQGIILNGGQSRSQMGCSLEKKLLG